MIVGEIEMSLLSTKSSTTKGVKVAKREEIRVFNHGFHGWSRIREMVAGEIEMRVCHKNAQNAQNDRDFARLDWVGVRLRLYCATPYLCFTSLADNKSQSISLLRILCILVAISLNIVLFKKISSVFICLNPDARRGPTNVGACNPRQKSTLLHSESPNLRGESPLPYGMLVIRIMIMITTRRRRAVPILKSSSCGPPLSSPLGHHKIHIREGPNILRAYAWTGRV